VVYLCYSVSYHQHQTAFLPHFVALELWTNFTGLDGESRKCADRRKSTRPAGSHRCPARRTVQRWACETTSGKEAVLGDVPALPGRGVRGGSRREGGRGAEGRPGGSIWIQLRDATLWNRPVA